MAISRESIAGIAVRAREVYATAASAFSDYTWDEMMYEYQDGPEGQARDEHNQDRLIFKEGVEELIPVIAAGLEAVGASRSSKIFRKNAARRYDTKPMEVHYHPVDTDTFWSPLLLYCHHHLCIIEAAAGDLILPARQAELKVLERILESTGQILRFHQINPSREKQVYDAVGEHLKAAFNGLEKHPKISATLKHYQPEFGVVDVGAVIEYKLAKSEKEIVTRIDELATDVHGYRPVGQWETFYAVIHMMDNWITPGKIKQHISDLNFPDNWRVITTCQLNSSANSSRRKKATKKVSRKAARSKGSGR